MLGSLSVKGRSRDLKRTHSPIAKRQKLKLSGENLSFGFPTRSDTNQAETAIEDRGLKFPI